MPQLHYRRHKAVLLGSMLLCSSVVLANESAPADLILHGGKIYTVDADDTVVDALAIRDGVIIHAGDEASVEAYKGPESRVLDLQGRMVMPGLQDAHIHGVMADRPRCDLEYQPLSVEQLQRRVQACLANPQFGGNDDWLVVDHWYIQFLTPLGTTVSREALDALDTDRPIVVNGVWGHSALANSHALELAAINADTPNTDDGVVGKDDSGEPNGWLYDGAMRLVEDAIPTPPPLDPVESARRGLEALAAEGITTFQAQSMDRDTVAAFAELRDRQGLILRSHFLIDSGARTGDDLQAFIAELDDIRAAYEKPELLPLQVREWRPQHVSGPELVAEAGLSVDGVGEIMADGILQSPTQTAALLEPYLVNEGSEEAPHWVKGHQHGEAYIDGQTLGIMATQFAANGYQTQIHAIGDRAVRNTLDAFAALRSSDDISGGYDQPGDSRPLMSHAELVADEDVPRFSELGVVPVMSYQWAKPGPDSTDAVEPWLGEERWAGYEPEGELAAAGTRIAYGSDYPVDPLDHWFAIEAAVLREADWGPEFPRYAGDLNAEQQALSLHEALRGITLNAAYAMHQDDVTGSLEPGKLADLIVLDQNLFEIPVEDISETRVLMTMVGGKVVHQAEDSDIPVRD